jgi:phosphoribosyl 1,2-cyclic phosphodiesterase
MPLQILSIASGSNGNCYYVANDSEAVLIDAGISCRELQRRATRAGIDLGLVKAIFISHEHSDHIRGLEAIARKWNLPVFGTPACLSRCRMDRSAHLSVTIQNNETVHVGGLAVTAFAKRHDACDPVSFVVESEDGVRVGVLTDIGRCCDEVVQQFSRCHAAFLESNYDTDMLMHGRYPAHLKQRIRGGHGHLSNDEALELFLEHRSPALSHLILSHLSANNNDPRIVEQVFRPHAGGVEVVVASRHAESEVFIVHGREVSSPSVRPVLSTQRAMKIATAFDRGRSVADGPQLKLF